MITIENKYGLMVDNFIFYRRAFMLYIIYGIRVEFQYIIVTTVIFIFSREIDNDDRQVTSK